jgi:hypothetical protein
VTTVGNQRVVGAEFIRDLRLAALFDIEHLVDLVPHGVVILEIEGGERTHLDAAALLDGADFFPAGAADLAIGLHVHDVRAGDLVPVRHAALAHVPHASREEMP